MALYSLRLASVTTVVALTFAATATSRSPLPAAMLTVAVVAWAARSWLRTRRRWSDPGRRALIAHAVAAG
jgi:hypothetical protein